MAWRPYEYLIGGELEFKNNKALGWIYMLTIGVVRIRLKQNYIASGKVRFEKPFEKIQQDIKSMVDEGGGRI